MAIRNNRRIRNNRSNGGNGNVRHNSQPKQSFDWSWTTSGGISKMAGRYYSSNHQRCDCRCVCDVPMDALTMPDGTLCPTSAPHGGPKFHPQQPHPIGHLDDMGLGGNGFPIDNCDTLVYYDWNGNNQTDVTGHYCHFEQHGVNDGPWPPNPSYEFQGVESSQDCTNLCENHCHNNAGECGQLHGSCGGLGNNLNDTTTGGQLIGGKIRSAGHEVGRNNKPLTNNRNKLVSNRTTMIRKRTAKGDQYVESPNPRYNKRRKK